MPRRSINYFWFSLAACSLALLTACHAPPQSSTLTLGDFNEATARMAASLAASEFLINRTHESPPILIITSRIENLTSDIISPAEQWMLLARLQGSLPILELGKQKNLRFQIPSERRLLTRQPDQPLDPAPTARTTHVMKAVFRSSTRTVRQPDDQQITHRQDYYTLQYEITDLLTRRIVWTDQFEFKRQALGLLID